MEKFVTEKVNFKRIMPIIVGLLAIIFTVGVLFASTKAIAKFNPNADDNNDNTLSAMISNEAFDGNDKTDNGYEINKNTQDDKSLQEGNDEPLKNPNSNSNGGLKLGNGNNGNTSGNGINTNGDGPTVEVNPGNGDGSNPGGDDGGSNGGINSNKNDVHIGEVSYEETEDTPKFSNSNISEFYFENASSVTVTTTAKTMYLCPKELPTNNYVNDYISVSEYFLMGMRGTNFTGVYSYQNNPTKYGGDFLIDWNSNTANMDNNVPSKAGKYTAKVYAYNRAKGTKTEGDTFSYYVVDYRVKLLDFDEKFSTLNKDELVQTIHASGQRKCDLTSGQNAMIKQLITRGSSGKDYKHILKISSKGIMEGCFLGWSKDKTNTSASSSYILPRATSDTVHFDSNDIPYYETSLYPIWDSKGSTSSAFKIKVNSTGDIVLYGYNNDSSKVTSMDIPDGVTVLDLSTLSTYGFSNLKLINIPSTVTKIIFPSNMNTFPKLASFGVNSSNGKYIDVDGVLYDKAGKNLLKVPTAKTSIKLWSKYVDNIGENAFNSVKMDYVSLPKTVETVEAYGLAKSSIKELVINNGDITLGERALSSNTATDLSVKKITVEDSENDVNYLNTLVACMSYLKEDGYSDFAQITMDTVKCNNPTFTDYKYKDGWITCDSGTLLAKGTPFVAKTSTIPEGVEIINKGVLNPCTALTKLTLPTTLKKLDSNSLVAENLSEIYFTASTAPSMLNGSNIMGYDLPQNCKLYVPGENYLSYRADMIASLKLTYTEAKAETAFMPYGDTVFTENNASYWKNPDTGDYTLIEGSEVSGVLTLKAGTVNTKPYSCKGNTAITEVVLPQGFSEIGNYSFANCSSLVKVDNGSSGLTVINDGSFSDCTSLNNFYWHNASDTNALNYLGSFAFSNTALTGLDAGITQKDIFDNTRYNSAVIFEANYRSGRNWADTFTNLKTIGYNAFSNCKRLGHMSIPTNLDYRTDGAYSSFNDYLIAKWNYSWFVGSNRVSPIGTAKTILDADGGSEGGDII